MYAVKRVFICAVKYLTTVVLDVYKRQVQTSQKIDDSKREEIIYIYLPIFENIRR